MQTQNTWSIEPKYGIKKTVKVPNLVRGGQRGLDFFPTLTVFFEGFPNQYFFFRFNKIFLRFVQFYDFETSKGRQDRVL